MYLSILSFCCLVGVWGVVSHNICFPFIASFQLNSTQLCIRAHTKGKPIQCEKDFSTQPTYFPQSFTASCCLIQHIEFKSSPPPAMITTEDGWFVMGFVVDGGRKDYQRGINFTITHLIGINLSLLHHQLTKWVQDIPIFAI